MVFHSIFQEQINKKFEEIHYFLYFYEFYVSSYFYVKYENQDAMSAHHKKNHFFKPAGREKSEFSRYGGISVNSMSSDFISDLF